MTCIDLNELDRMSNEFLPAVETVQLQLVRPLFSPTALDQYHVA